MVRRVLARALTTAQTPLTSVTLTQSAVSISTLVCTTSCSMYCFSHLINFWLDFKLRSDGDFQSHPCISADYTSPGHGCLGVGADSVYRNQTELCRVESPCQHYSHVAPNMQYNFRCVTLATRAFCSPLPVPSSNDATLVEKVN